jgi:hypothetical protein
MHLSNTKTVVRRALALALLLLMTLSSLAIGSYLENEGSNWNRIRAFHTPRSDESLAYVFPGPELLASANERVYRESPRREPPSPHCILSAV